MTRKAMLHLVRGGALNFFWSVCATQVSKSKNEGSWEQKFAS